MMDETKKIVIAVLVLLVLLAGILAVALVDVPVLGTLIGNAVGMFMNEIAKTYLSAAEQKLISKYQQDCVIHTHYLKAKYDEYLVQLNAEIIKFDSLITLAFNGDINQKLNSSIELARVSGANEEMILKTKEERDSFFSE